MRCVVVLPRTGQFALPSPVSFDEPDPLANVESSGNRNREAALSELRYRAFVSYSHASDARLAGCLQQSLSQFAKPWYRLRTMRIFLDKTSLAANPALWPTIEQALGQAEYFLLLASPTSANSAWVQQEVNWWLKNRTADKLVICLTDGAILWDARTGDFDWQKTSAIPSNLKGAYSSEPLYADFRAAKAANRYGNSDPIYREPLLDVAAPLMGRPKDDLDGEDIRQHRRTERIAWAAALMMAVLVVIAAIGLNMARERQKLAASRALASEAMSHADDRSLAMLLSIESGQIADTVESKRALLASIQHAAKAEAILWGHTDAVTKAVFCPDGSSILSAGWDDRIILWNAKSHKPIGQPIPSPKGLVGVAFNPDGSQFVSSSSGSVVVWDAKSHRPIGKPFRANQDFVHVAFSSKGNLLAASTEAYGGRPSVVFLWNIATHQQIGDPIPGTNFAFSPDDALLAVALFGDVVFYDLHSHRALNKPRGGHGKNISSIAFSPDGGMVATGSEDKSIILWDVASRKSIGSLVGHSQAISSLLFTPDGESLYSGSLDGIIIQWDLENGKPARTPITGLGGSVSSIFLSPDGELKALALDKERVILLNLNEDPPLGRHIKAVGSGSSNAAFSPDGRLLASGGDFGDVVLWDVATAQQSGMPLSGHERQVSSLAFAPDGKTLVSGSMDGTIIFWDVASQKALEPPVKALRSPVWSLACSPDAKTVVAGGDAEFVFWDLATRKQIGPPVTSQKDRIWALAFSPGGDLLASAGNNLTVSIWKNGQHDRVFKTVGTPAQGESLELMPAGVAFSSDGSMLATTTQGHSVTLWNIKNWQPISPVLYGDTQAVSGVAFRPDGKLLVSASADGDIRLWDVRTHELIGILGMQPEAVNSITFAPGKAMLASVGEEDSIVLWNLDFQDWITHACQIANRDLTPKEWNTYIGTRPYRKTCPIP
ncbi:MAG TPA: TIR domain-containing protein [Terracidiphilus sp.]|jgi:WD40 repeat protein